MTDNAVKTPIPLLLTRPKDASEAFWDGLPIAFKPKLRPVISPLIEIVPIAPPPVIPESDIVIFSSTNGPRYVPPGDGRVAYCIGAATTARAKLRGWKATQMGNDSTEFLAAMADHPKNMRTLHVSGRHTRGDIMGNLLRAGFKSRAVVVYDQATLEFSKAATKLLQVEQDVIAPLFSPRTARQFREKLPPETKARLNIIGLSEAVTDVLDGIPMKRLVACTLPTVSEMHKEIGINAHEFGTT